MFDAVRGFDASSINYGQVLDDASSLLEGACPIVASFRGKDKMLKGAAAGLKSALTAIAPKLPLALLTAILMGITIFHRNKMYM